MDRSLRTFRSTCILHLQEVSVSMMMQTIFLPPPKHAHCNIVWFHLAEECTDEITFRATVGSLRVLGEIQVFHPVMIIQAKYQVSGEACIWLFPMTFIPLMTTLRPLIYFAMVFFLLLKPLLAIHLIQCVRTATYKVWISLHAYLGTATLPHSFGKMQCLD